MRRTVNPQRLPAALTPRISAAMHAAKARRREQGPAPDRPADWPADQWERRVTIDVRRADGQVRRWQWELVPAGSRQYRIVCGQRTWMRAGWSTFLRRLAGMLPGCGPVARATSTVTAAPVIRRPDGG